MKVKRIVARDMRQALKEVSRQLGPEAVVLSSRNLQEGGVEILAGEPDAARQSGENFNEVLKDQQVSMQGRALRDSLAALGGSAAPAGRKPPGEAAKRPDSAAHRQSSSAGNEQPVAQEAGEMRQMRSELNTIRSLLQQRLAGLAWEQFSQRTPVQASIWEKLGNMGVPGYLSRDLLERLKPEYTPAQAWRFTLAWLNRAVPVRNEDPVAKGGVFAFLGPTGVGKTTTIGKLATRYVLEHGADSVALVTTDSYRIAAHEQLRTLGRILGVSVRVVDQRHDLAGTLESLTHKSLVLVDTAGLNGDDPAMQSQLLALQEVPQVQKYLVLSCTSQGRVLDRAWRDHAPANLNGCILTKLDEAGTLGEVLALVIDRCLPVVYETHGQGIPDDLSVAHAHRLVSRAVALGLPEEEEHKRSGDRERRADAFGLAWGNGLNNNEVLPLTS